MDLHHALATRRTIQRFRKGAVPAEVLDRALAAAAWAPNHKLTFPWRFLVVGPRTREVVFQAGLRLKSAKKGSSPELEQAVRRDLLDPDRLVAVVQRVDADPNRALEDYATCACAAQHLMLSVHADGFGSKWGTGGMLRDDEVLTALGVRADERVVAFVWIGVPDVVPAPPSRPLDRTSWLP